MKIDVGMLNTVENELADVLSVSPSFRAKNPNYSKSDLVHSFRCSSFGFLPANIKPISMFFYQLNVCTQSRNSQPSSKYRKYLKTHWLHTLASLRGRIPLVTWTALAKVRALGV